MTGVFLTTHQIHSLALANVAVFYVELFDFTQNLRNVSV